MGQRGRKLIAAALSGGLAISFSPTSTKAQTPDDSQQQARPSGPAAKKKGAKDRPALLIGVVPFTPIGLTDLALPQGARYEIELDEADALRASLASVTGAVFGSDGELNDVIDKLVDPDRDRLDQYPGRERDFERGSLTQLEAKVDELKRIWADKYGEEFEIKENQVYAPLLFAEGEITDPRQFMRSWPVGANRVAASKRTQAHLEAGRDFAVVLFPAEGGLPETHVSFIDEAFGWKIDVPDDLTTAALRTRLLEQLTSFGARAEQWPDDVNDAYRLASHHVALALIGRSPRT